MLVRCWRMGVPWVGEGGYQVGVGLLVWTRPGCLRVSMFFPAPEEPWMLSPHAQAWPSRSIATAWALPAAI